MTQAIVLSGGGSRGDFQVGALHYLFKEKGIRPDLLTTTSVGSVNGLKLAEGEGAPDQGLSGLTAAWLALDSYVDFFKPAAWLTNTVSHPEVRTLIRNFVTRYAQGNSPAVEADLSINEPLNMLLKQDLAARSQEIDLTQITDKILPAGLNFIQQLEFAVTTLPVSAAMVLQYLLPGGQLLLEDLAGASSFFLLDPLRELASRLVDPAKIAAWRAGGRQLAMATVELGSGEMRYVTADGAVLDGAGQPVTTPTLPAACSGLNSQVIDLQGQVKDMQMQLVHGDHSAGAGWALINAIRNLKQAQEALAACMQANPSGKAPVKFDLVNGMIASSSIPVFFGPVGDLVDGGIRAVLPTEAALLLTPKPYDVDIIGIQASSGPIDAADSAWTVPSIALRALGDITINEISRRDAHPPGGWPAGVRVKIIEPGIDVHTPFTIYPAFIRNRMAYGWMCAADALDPPSDAAAAKSARDMATRISVLRYGCARIEAWLANRPVPPFDFVHGTPAVPSVLLAAREALKQMKAEIQDSVQKRIAFGARVPDGRADWDNPKLWWGTQEVHPWNRTPRDDASVRTSALPVAVRTGASFGVDVTAANVGNTEWDPAQGYALLVAADAAGRAWPERVAPLPGLVSPGEQVKLRVDVTAPTQAGKGALSWQMARNGGGFGAASDPQVITVTQGEPADCQDLRSKIATIDADIASLKEQLNGDQHHDAQIMSQINRLQTTRATLVSQGNALGCAAPFP